MTLRRRLADYLLRLACRIDEPEPMTVRDVVGVCSDVCAEDEATPLWLRVALVMARPRCVGCGYVVSTTVVAKDVDGEERVGEIHTACDNEHCRKLAVVVLYEEPMAMADARIVARLGGVRMGRVS